MKRLWLALAIIAAVHIAYGGHDFVWTVVGGLAIAMAFWAGVPRGLIRICVGLILILNGFVDVGSATWRNDLTASETHALDAAKAAGFNLSESDSRYLSERDYIFENAGPLISPSTATDAAAPSGKYLTTADRIAVDSAFVTMYSSLAQESLVEVSFALTVIGVGVGLVFLQPLRDSLAGGRGNRTVTAGSPSTAPTDPSIVGDRAADEARGEKSQSDPPNQ